MSLLLTHLDGHPDILNHLKKTLNIPAYPIIHHQFPDQESLIKINWSCENQTVLLLTSLENPNPKILPLLFAAKTLKAKGAKQVILIAPYLAYMRQDKSFHPSEGITAHYFAELISPYFDGLITIDPHLHRIPELSDIYSIPTFVGHAAPLLAEWIKNHLSQPVLIGPDAESEQWIKATAQNQNLPHFALEKKRLGDTSVEITSEDLTQWQTHTPVLVDDIISSGHTMIEASKLLREQLGKKPAIVCIHGLFAQNSDALLLPYCTQLITTNAVLHQSNQIDVTPLIVEGIHQLT